MTYKRLPYDEASSPAEMASDSKAVGVALHLPRQVTRMARTAVGAFPEGLVPTQPPQIRRVQITVSDAAARLAGRLFD